jgi:hypothetical protein
LDEVLSSSVVAVAEVLDLAVDLVLRAGGFVFENALYKFTFVFNGRKRHPTASTFSSLCSLFLFGSSSGSWIRAKTKE